MNRLSLRSLLPHATLTLAAAACTPLSAAVLPFSATYSGTSNVVEVIDPAVPVLRFATLASGLGSFDLGNYVSTDVIDMSTGAGTGVNTFTAGNGDELYGTFIVQVIPTSVANIVQLIGQATFVGGTGLFLDASGQASFSGTGMFTSATSAIANLSYGGEVALVPEPAAWAMWLAGALAMKLVTSSRTGATHRSGGEKAPIRV
jgi:hypothetical protein